MNREEIRRRVLALKESGFPGSRADLLLSSFLELIGSMDDEAEADDPPVALDEGFVVLPIARFAEFCKAEETLQETRFEPTDGEPDEKQATIDALTRENAQLKAVMNSWEVFVRIQGAEIARLAADAKVRAEAAAPPRTAEGAEEMSRRVDHLIRRVDELGNTAGVHLRHIQDFQAEIDGIKERLDEITRESRTLKSRLDQVGALGLIVNSLEHQVDDMTPSFDAKLGAHWDRINALVARLNKVEARDVVGALHAHTESRLAERADKARKVEKAGEVTKS